MLNLYPFILLNTLCLSFIYIGWAGFLDLLFRLYPHPHRYRSYKTNKRYNNDSRIEEEEEDEERERKEERKEQEQEEDKAKYVYWPFILTNLFILHPFLAILLYPYFENSFYTDCLSFVFLYELFQISILYDFTFYFTHRSCHESILLYRYIHRFHHRHIITRALNTLDTHPFEHAFVNLSPIVIATCFLSVSWNSIVVFVIMGAIISVHSHSGQKYISFAGHDLHHRCRNCEYGVVFTDWIFNTNRRDLN